MANYIRKQATTCTIGSTVFPEIMYYAYKPVGSGPGGDLVSPRMVANTVFPIGIIPHHIWYELELCIDADDLAALWTSDAVVSHAVVATVSVTESAITVGTGAIVTRTITFSPSYVKNMSPVKVEDKAEHQPFIVTMLYMGEPGFGAWT